MTPIIVILGPTGIGKSKLAIETAVKENCEIISADAFQVYKEFDIGTAKVSKDEQKQVRHHLIDHLNPTEPYNVVDFLTQTENLLKDTTKNYIICGGTAYYLSAFLYQYNFSEAPESDPTLRQSIEKELEIHGKDPLLEELKVIDPKLFQTIDKNNPRRLIRSIEIARMTKKAPSSFTIKGSFRENCQVIGITSTREIIYDRINKRVDQMFSHGLLDEVSYLKSKYPNDAPAFQAIGYKQCLDYFNGLYDKETLIDTIKKCTRQFAKRQETWFKKFEHVNWIS